MDVREALRHRDGLLAGMLAVAYPVEAAMYDHIDHAVAIPLAVLTALALTTRRRLPFATFVVVMVLNVSVVHFSTDFDGNSIFFVLIFLLSLWSLGRYASGVEAWLGVLGCLGTVVLFVLGDGAHAPSDVFFATAFVGTPWAAGVAVRLRRARETELAANNAELEEQARRAVADERARIARELHDVVSHAIAVTVLQARGGRRMVGRDDEQVRRALDASERTNTSALSDLRRLLSLLRETDGSPGTRDEPPPSLEQLDVLVEQVRGSGLQVDLQVSGEAVPVPPGVDLSAYRIVQEALTNVLKHAGPGARATVEVRYGENDLDVAVRNTGAVAVTAPPGGHGLIGIRERAAVTGGSVEAGPEPDGFTVRARLPYSVTA